MAQNSQLTQAAAKLKRVGAGADPAGSESRE